MRVLLVGALGMGLWGCSTSPVPPSESRAAQSCVVCPGDLQAVWRADETRPVARAITPVLDAAALARRLGHPELDGQIEEKLLTAETRVQSATSDEQARAIVDTLIAELDHLR